MCAPSQNDCIHEPDLDRQNQLRTYDDVLAFIASFNNFRRMVTSGISRHEFRFWMKFRPHRRVERQFKGKTFLQERHAVDRRHCDSQLAISWLIRNRVLKSDERWGFVKVLKSEYPLHKLALEVDKRFQDVDFEELSKLHKWYSERSQRGTAKLMYERLLSAGLGFFGGSLFQIMPGLNHAPKFRGITLMIGGYLLAFAALMGLVSIAEFLRSDKLLWAGDVICYLATVKRKDAPQELPQG